MHKTLRKIIATLLLVTNFTQVAVAALPLSQDPYKNHKQAQQNKNTGLTPIGAYPTQPIPENLAFSTEQFGIAGPLNGGINYSNLTGAFFNGQFLQKISESMGIGVLGELGDMQYRLNGTIGFILNAQSLFKVSAERFNQKLPFNFDSGLVEQRVSQDAVGFRYQQFIDFSILNNLTLGGYAAKAQNVNLAPIYFTSNGTNCFGFESGLQCVTERNIAGATSAGADIGAGTYLTPSTYLEGKLYYDSIEYNTLFARSAYDSNGIGAGLYAQQLITSNLKLSAGAEIRKIYDTYNLALSWMPPFRSISEISLTAQRVISHNQTPDNDIIGLQFTFLSDKTNHRDAAYRLNATPVLSDINTWVKQPAVKMSQVLAVAEQFTHLVAPFISSLTPNFGPLMGGNTVTISGSNFPGSILVKFGDKIATITAVSKTLLTVIVPGTNKAGPVDVTLITPDNQGVLLEHGYLYSNDGFPIMSGMNPNIISVTGAFGIVISGTGFVPGQTTVSVGGVAVIPTAITPTSITFDAPAHAPGTVTIKVNTPAGTSAPLPGGLMYVTAPIVNTISPASGPLTGLPTATISGSGFIPGVTVVNWGGTLITPLQVTATTINIQVLPHAAGTVDVSVTTPVGTSANLGGGFTYIGAPTVATLSPALAPVTGQSGIVLTGTNFVSGNTTVNLDGQHITPTVVTSTSLTFNAPAHAPGTVAVSVTTPSGTSANVPGGFTYNGVLTVGVLNPAGGPVSGVSNVTLSGTGFVPGSTTVNFDGSSIIPTAVTTTSLTFNAPAHAAGTVGVSVTTPAGVSSNVAGGFTYVAPPTVGTLTPAIISTAGQAGIVLTGTGFVSGGTTLTLDGSPITPTSVSATSLTFTAPAHASGTVAVSVTTSAGTSAAVAGGLTYAAMPSVGVLTPAIGPSSGSSGVTLSGTGFVPGNTTVTIDGIVVTPTSVTPTLLTFNVPSHAPGTVAVSVTTPIATSAPVNGGYTYVDNLTAGTLSPNVGNVNGAPGVSLTGTGFVQGSTTVTIGGNLVTPTSVTPTQLIFNAPVHVAGAVPVTVTTPLASVGVAGGFTYVDSPSVGVLTPSAGPTTGLNNITLSGAGFVSGNTIINFDGSPITPTTITSGLLTFNAPAHAAGTVAVSVTTPAGTSPLVDGGFTYVSAIPTVGTLTPAIIPITGNAGIVLTGTGFISGNTTVMVDGAPITPYMVTSTSLVFDAPSHVAGQVDVSVTNPVGNSANVVGGLTYVAQPTAGVLNPAIGPVTGLAGVTVSGTNFTAGSVVNFDGTLITPSSITPTLLTFNAPAHAAGTVVVAVTTPGGMSNTVSGGFTYVAPPTAGVLSPSFVSINGQAGLTLSGTNFVVGNTTVSVDGVTITPTNVTSTSISFDVSAHAPGNVAVIVSTPIGNATVVGGLTYVGSPTINSITPSVGPLTATTGIVLSGTGFIAGNTVVNFDGSPITPTSVTATSVTFNVPAHAAGVVGVSVTTPIGTSASVSYTYSAGPTVNVLTPASGNISGAAGIVLTGTNFIPGNTTVTIGGSVVTPTLVTAGSLTFDAPPHAAGTVAVSVTTPAGVSGNVAGGFTYTAAPTATLLTPAIGNITGVAGVTIAGSGFVAGTVINFDGSPIVPTIITSGLLTFDAPAHAAGTVAVSVTTPAGTTANISGGFTYTSAPTAGVLTPSVISVAGAAGITLSGTGFVAGAVVTVDGSPIVPTLITPTLITFDAPAHASGVVSVNVTTVGGTSADVVGGLTYAAAPTLSLLTPSAAPLTGLAGVTLTGTNFVSGSTIVNFDGSPIVPTVVTPTSLTFDAPPHAAGSVTVSVTTPINTSNALGFTYTLAPTVGALTPFAGSTAGVAGIVLSGSGFVAGNTTVNFDGNPIIPTLVTANSLTFDAPSHLAGVVNVSVSTPAGMSANVNGGFTFLDFPTVGLLTPSSVSIDGAVGLQLAGTGFISGATTVVVDGNVIIPTAVTPTLITFNVPAHPAGTVMVHVVTPAGTSADVVGGLTYLANPTAIAITPAIGPTTGVPGATITGSGFVAGTVINFDGGTIVPTVITPTLLTFNAPSHVVGNVVVSVTTPAGTTAPISGGFTYIAPPTVGILTPFIVSLSGKIGVTLSGTGFVSGSTTVNVDGVDIIPTLVTSTLITFDAPAHALGGTVTVYVTAPGGVSANVVGGLTYVAAPTAALLTPSAAPLSGLPNVILTGTGFVAGNTTINFDGNLITPTVVTPTSLTFAAPAHAAGNVAVSVTTPVGTSTNVIGGFTYVAPPTVGVLSPIAGPITGLANITLTGTGFVAANTQVNIGGTLVTPTSVSPTTLTFDAPPHSAGNVSVFVVTPAGVSGNVSGGFTYAAAPTVIALTPNGSPLTGYVGVTLSGSNFIPNATIVTVDGLVVTPTTVLSNLITFTAPAHAAGVVDVSVTTPAGVSGNVSGGFTYTDAPTVGILNPAAVPVTGYFGVTLSGTGFVAGSTTLTVDGVAVTPVLVTPTSITFNAPVHVAGNVAVIVTTPAGSATVAGGLTYAGIPTVGVLNPSGGPIGGVSGVTLTGTGFVAGHTIVNFDGVSITPTSVSSTSLTFNAPPHALGNVVVSVTTPVGTSINVSGGFTYVGSPTVGVLVPSFVPVTGYVGITLSGTGFVSGGTQINVDGTPVTPTIVTPTLLTFNAPAHAAGNVDVSVTTNAGTSANVTNGLTYLGNPTVGTLTPNQGNVTGVNGVILTGTGFAVGNTTVNIDGNAVTPTLVTPSAITFNAPAHVAGTVAVNVTTPVGTSANVPGGFTYVAIPTIASCTYPGGPLTSAWLCTGLNMNAFPNTYLNIQGGLTCSLGVGISLLTTTVKDLLNLGGNTILPNLYAGCTIKLCNNSTCSGLQSNVIAFT